MPRSVIRRPLSFHRFTISFPSTFGLLLLALVSASSCGTSAPPNRRDDEADPSPQVATSQNSSSRPTSPTAADDGSAKTTEAAEETWDVCVIQKTKVGYVHTIVRHLTEQDEPLVQIELEQFLIFRRFDQQTIQQLSLTSVETPHGELRRFESRLTAGTQLTLSRGRVEGDKLVIETTTPGKTSQTSIDWPAKSGGFFTAELQMRQRPLKPGEKRTHAVILPALNQRSTSKLEALVYEATTIGDTSQRLLKVRKTDLVGGTPIESILWVDERGEALKSLLTMSPLQIETRRTTREEALADGEDGGFDLGTMSIVKVAKRIPDPHATRRVLYRATIPEGDADTLFETGLSQSIKKLGPQAVQLEVRAVRGDTPADAAASQEPNAADRASNNLVQSDAPIIVKMANQVSPQESDPWKLATALEQHVRKTIRAKNFSQAFATAAEVAETKTGDCTEHAVLLAALCRARGIPARVAIGLVYSSELGGFAYHMWNEVWIRDHWVPLDATLGRGGIGGAHLKLLTSNLQGYDAYGAFLPVFRVLGKLQLEVLEIE